MEDLVKKDEININDLSAEQRLALVTQYSINYKNEVKGKVDFYDTVTNSDNWMDMSEVAKVLNYKGYGRNKTFELLRKYKVLRYNNQPFQNYVDVGYFKLIEQSWTHPYSGNITISFKTVISQRGLDYIRKVLEEETNIEEVNNYEINE